MWVGFPRVCWPLWASLLSLMFLTLLFIVVFLDYPRTFAAVLSCVPSIFPFCMMCCLWSLFPFCNTHFSVDFLELLILFLFSGFCFVFCFGGGCFYFGGSWSFSGAGYEPQGFILGKQVWVSLLNYTPASIVTTSALHSLMVSFIMSFRILHIGSLHLHV